MINEPNTIITYDGDREDLGSILPTVMSVCTGIRNEQQKTVDIGAFRRSIEGVDVLCKYTKDYTHITLSIPKGGPSKKIGKKKKEVIADIATMFVILFEKTTQRKWEGAQIVAGMDMYNTYDCVIAGGKWNQYSQSMEVSSARLMTRVEFDIFLYDINLTSAGDPNSPNLSSRWADQATTHNWLISLLPGLDIRGRSLLTSIDTVDTGVVWNRDLEHDILVRGGPKYAAGMWEASGCGTTPDTYMLTPITYSLDDTIGHTPNKYYQEYCWSYVPCGGAPALYSNGSSYWDTDTLNDFIVFDYYGGATLGHDWRIDNMTYTTREDSSVRLTHVAYGQYRYHLGAGDEEVYDTGKFTWLTRYGVMYDGHSLTSSLHVNADIGSGPQISDTEWGQAILKVQPWMVGDTIFDAVAIFGCINKDYGTWPAPASLVDCYSFWNLRGVCEQWNGQTADLQVAGDLYAAGIKIVINKAAEAVGATLYSPTNLPSDMLSGFQTTEGDFSGDPGVTMCNRGIILVSMYTIPTYVEFETWEEPKEVSINTVPLPDEYEVRETKNG